MTLVANCRGILIGGCLALAPAAGAQTVEELRAEAAFETECDSHFATAKAYVFNEETPFAVMSERGSLSWDCKITAFFAANLPTWQHPDRQPVYVIRRLRQRMGASSSVHFADSASCGNAREAVALIAQFRAPPIEIPGFRQLPNSVTIVADGSSHILWSDRLFNGDRRADTGDITLAASNNDAIAELDGRIDELLVECWQSAEPRLP
jgi:hypothetical protein